MNVGIVTTWFARGAAYVSRAYQEALSKQHQVFIYARGGEQYARGDPKWDTPYVTWGKRLRFGIPGLIHWPDFKDWILRNDIEVLIFNEQHSWDVILRCQKLGILLGAYIDYYTPVTVPFFGLYDFLLCNTRRHHSVFHYHPQAIYIPWGTDLQTFRPAQDWRPEQAVRFFHSCGISPARKGTDILLQAFRSLQGPAKLIIHSQVPIETGSYLDLIGKDERIQVIVKTIEPPGLYHLGDVYVYPTRLEGLGLTIAEALASGLPVVTTDNPPMSEFVQPGTNGQLVSVEGFNRRSDDYYWPESIVNVQKLWEALQFYIDHHSRLAEFRQQARCYAAQHLDWERNAASLGEQIPPLQRLEKSASLHAAVARYEYQRYPSQFLSALRRKITKGNV